MPHVSPSADPVTPYFENGRYGLRNPQVVAVPATCDAVWRLGPLVWGIRRADSFGLVSLTGQELLPCEVPAFLSGFREVTQEALAPLRQPDGLLGVDIADEYPLLIVGPDQKTLFEPYQVPAEAWTALRWDNKLWLHYVPERKEILWINTLAGTPEVKWAPADLLPNIAQLQQSLAVLCQESGGAYAAQLRQLRMINLLNDGAELDPALAPRPVIPFPRTTGTPPTDLDLIVAQQMTVGLEEQFEEHEAQERAKRRAEAQQAAGNPPHQTLNAMLSQAGITPVITSFNDLPEAAWAFCEAHLAERLLTREQEADDFDAWCLAHPDEDSVPPSLIDQLVHLTWLVSNKHITPDWQLTNGHSLPGPDVTPANMVDWYEKYELLLLIPALRPSSPPTAENRLFG